MLGDSLIGRTAGFDPVSPGSSPGPPAIFLTKYIFCYMLKFFVFIMSILTSIPLMASDDLETIFIQHLLKWNIYYEKLETNKAGAACFSLSNKKLESLGFSYQLADISYAKKVALAGCNQMKEKNKILSDCKCEIIFINNKFVGGK